MTTAGGDNFRINPNNGTLSGHDPNIVGAAISGVAYANNQPGTTVTTLYTLDLISDQLMIQNGNAGTQTVVGPTGVNFSNANGFDIAAGVNAAVNNGLAPGFGTALLTVDGLVGLYNINLVTGAATLVGNFLGGATPVSGFTIQNEAAPTDILGGPLVSNENSAVGTLVGNLIGQDPDHQVLAYTLTDNAGGRFAIDNAGQVTVANGVLLDFEQNAVHSIGVRVTDADGLFFDKVFAVTVSDLNPEVATGDAGPNTLLGGSGNDTINGAGGHDVILGGGGNDYITSGDGTDKAFGEAGNDTVIGGSGDDYLNGGADDDLIIGNDGADTLLGDTGNDYLDGGAGDDLVMGGAGNDTVLGADGNDYVNGEDGNDLVFGGDGIDTLLGADGNDYLDGENGNDVVFGDGGNDTIIGGEGNDYLSAGAGDDNLVGGNGNDTLFAGSGSDYLQGDAGDDFFIFDGTFQTSIIIDFEPGTLAHHDVIQFNGGVFTDFADMMSHAVQSATNAVITDAGGHTVILANVVKANLISDDFVFA